MELLKSVTVFLLAGQVILRLLPEGGYEKYVKMIMGIMVLSQLAVPILSFGGFDAESVFSEAMLGYEQEMQRIEEQIRQTGLQEGNYTEAGLMEAVSSQAEPVCREQGIRLLQASMDESGRLVITVTEADTVSEGTERERIRIAQIQVEGSRAETADEQENGIGEAEEGRTEELRQAFARALDMEPEKLEVIWGDGTS